jgi:cyclase
MAKKRIIPKLLLKKGGYKGLQNVVVRTKHFNSKAEIGEVVSQAKIFQDQLADEIIILKIDSNIHFDELIEIGNSISNEIFMPITIGGGIKEISDIEKLLKNGADKVSLNTIAFQKLDLIKTASSYYGSSTIVVCVDYKVDVNGNCSIFINNGNTKLKYNLFDWVKLFEDYGAGELILNCISYDGNQKGLDINTANQIEKLINIPIVLSGGCGNTNHFIEGFKKTNASGITSGTFFAMKDQNFMQIRSHIFNAGIDIRV